MGATRQFRAARLYETAMRNVATPPARRLMEVPPVWLKVLEDIPPSEILTRSVPVRHQPANLKLVKPKHTYRPQRITYEEDELRQTFYQDHPWELARPRVVLETDGKDARRLDWSRGPLQPGVQLTGECVVQRQLWLMHHEGLTKDQAYDKARKEFYWIRQQEEIERRIAQEEARMVGAYFGKSKVQLGLELEDRQFARWKTWAARETERIQAARSQAYVSFGEEKEEPEAETAVPAEALDEADVEKIE